MTKADKEGQRKAPILRFKGFTDDWEQRKLSDFTHIIVGGTPSTKKNEYWNGNIPWMSSGEINKKRIYKTDKSITKLGLENLSAKFVPKNSVLIALAGQGKTRGKVAINNIELTINQSLAGLIPTSESYYEFIFYNLEKRYSELRRLSSGAGSRGGLNKKLIQNIKIQIPDLREQTLISKLSETLDKVLTLYEMKKQLLTQLKQGIVNFLITKNGQKPQLRFIGFNNNWESKSFEKLLNYEQPTKYIVKKADYISQGTPVLTANKSFILGYTNETNVYQSIPAIIFDDFTLESKYVDFPFMVKSSAIKILTSKNSNLFFIYQLLNNQKFVQEGHSRHYISVVQKKKVLVPSIQEQNKIGNLIKQLENSIEQNSNTITLLKRLKEFLLQNMFL